ncbi:uncharacterized protein FIBRA_01854 [Fibroporia radiculosa]|uniref:Uncharacterized protein n=1 Tax=Fibroporia radiculosa TaxID=599839 RepID=J4GLK4_9APHY|nr:uncharacterized protein FIBRA_01854 [Fibroporia radiculosa]CCL99830.1 predicted protein [Fibroporia radiculosa]
MIPTLSSMLTVEPATLPLTTLLKAWPSNIVPPRFLGRPKQDPPIDVWLAKIAAACAAQKVPSRLWHEVARHFMGKEALRRIEDVEKVMRCVYGEQWKWKWATFGVAMKNMGWGTDSKKTEKVKVQCKASGSWWIIGRAADQSTEAKTKERLPDMGLWPRTVQWLDPRPMAAPQKDSTKARGTVGLGKPAKKTVKNRFKGADDHKRGQSILPRFLIKSQVSTPSTLPTTITVQIPIWLLAASEALLSLASQQSSAMSVLAAILIAVGSIPTLPVVSAGGTAHALGSIAVGLGALLREKALLDGTR